jgi:hypothetical protein
MKTRVAMRRRTKGAEKNRGQRHSLQAVGREMQDAIRCGCRFAGVGDQNTDGSDRTDTFAEQGEHASGVGRVEIAGRFVGQH